MRLPRPASDPAGIDTAPLIDCVFQLLLFFMLTSSFILYPGIKVSLPKAVTGQQTTASSFVITLTKEHLIYWGDQAVTMKALRQHLKQTGSGTPVLIRTDRRAYVDRLIELWDLCRDTGHTEVHIATLAE